MPYVHVAAGLLLLFLGGEVLVRGSVSLARHLGMSTLLIGLTVVGFGTSAPELLVSVQAALGGAPDISLGNVVGSNIANILLILGVTTLISPLKGWRPTVHRDAAVMCFVSLILLVLVYNDFITTLNGVVLLVLLVTYLAGAYWLERRSREAGVFAQEAEDLGDVSLSPAIAAVAVVGGIAVLVFGAHLLVGGATTLARHFGIPEAVIGLSLVAIGTSLPELATGIVAALRGHPDVVLGNVIGSNIFNILCILGVTSVIEPIGVSRQFPAIDVPLMMAVSMALLLVLTGAKRVGRPMGVGMLVAYGVYMAFLFLNRPL